MKRFILILLFLVIALTGCEQPLEGPPIRIGYMNCNSEEAAFRTIAGTARSMGVEIVD